MNMTTTSNTTASNSAATQKVTSMSNTQGQTTAQTGHLLTNEELFELLSALADRSDGRLKIEEFNAIKDRIASNHGAHGRDLIQQVVDRFKARPLAEKQVASDEIVLPDIEDAAYDYDPGKAIEEPDRVIEGILHKGCKLVLGGPSKARKTWNLIALAYAVATGGKWMGKFQCNKGKVLYLNFELIPYTFQYRRRLIGEAMGVTKETQGGNLHIMNLKGKANSIERIVPAIVRKIQEKAAYGDGYALVIFDPIYKSLGGRDENAAGPMAELVNHLETICTETEAALAFAAHFPKGNVEGRKSQDRIAGSGVFSRDPEAILTMTPKEYKGSESVDPSSETASKDYEMLMKMKRGEVMTIGVDLRNFEGLDEFDVEWEFPLFKAIGEERSAEMKAEVERRKANEKHQTKTRILDWYKGHIVAYPHKFEEGIKADDWANAVGWPVGSDQRQAFRFLLKEIGMEGHIERVGGGDLETSKKPWKLKVNPAKKVE